MADWDWGAQFGDDDDDDNEEGGGYQKVLSVEKLCTIEKLFVFNY